MKENECFQYKNQEKELYVQGKVIEVKEHSYIVSLVGDYALHEFPKDFLDNMEQVGGVKTLDYIINRFEETV